MDDLYPILLTLKGKSVVIIGGGKIAERKVKSLIGTGAQLEVVSPELTFELENMANNMMFNWKKKRFTPDDIENAFLVIAATNDAATNQFIKSHSLKNQLVSLVDDQENSDFQIPAVLKRGKLKLAISTSGASPILAKKIKKQLEQDFDERYENYLEFLQDARKTILSTIKDSTKKKKLLTAIVDHTFLESKNRWKDFQELLDKEINEPKPEK